jgi:phosphopantothenoylcysteine decarboxylase/phosphopantothenate--cysteine ligase
MLDPVDIVRFMGTFFVEPILKNKKIMITAGPTEEPLDPVRYITNRSSGKMGYAIATAAKALGAEVKLISGPTSLKAPVGVACTHVATAQEMLDAVMSQVEGCDIFIATAAVADYKPKKIAKQKLKKTSTTQVISLVRNPDILSQVAQLPSPPFTVGFAAETEHVLANALKKLKNKKIDMIVANDVSDNKVFGRDDNALTILTKRGEQFKLPPQNKNSLAYELLALIADHLQLKG